MKSMTPLLYHSPKLKVPPRPVLKINEIIIPLSIGNNNWRYTERDVNVVQPFRLTGVAVI